MIAPAKTFEVPLLLTSERAAAMLSISERTLSRLTAPRGTLRAVRIGSGKKPLLRYRVVDLQAFVQEGGAT